MYFLKVQDFIKLANVDNLFFSVEGGIISSQKSLARGGAIICKKCLKKIWLKKLLIKYEDKLKKISKLHSQKNVKKDVLKIKNKALFTIAIL